MAGWQGALKVVPTGAFGAAGLSEAHGERANPASLKAFMPELLAAMYAAIGRPLERWQF